MFEKDGNVWVIYGLENQYLPDLPKKDTLGGPRIACGVVVEG
jgi:hypothetical protein